ncbi:hypothetical protein FHS15_001532 [Paenibacillus castaneae]|nr:hypothetical protein [Paenibacillus castaneae]
MGTNGLGIKQASKGFVSRLNWLSYRTTTLKVYLTFG